MNLVATKNAENAKELGLGPRPQKPFVPFALFVFFAAKNNLGKENIG